MKKKIQLHPISLVSRHLAMELDWVIQKDITLKVKDDWRLKHPRKLEEIAILRAKICREIHLDTDYTLILDDAEVDLLMIYSQKLSINLMTYENTVYTQEVTEASNELYKSLLKTKTQ